MANENKNKTKSKSKSAKKTGTKKKDYAWLDGKRKKFTSEHQPSIESRKKGWEKRRVKQEIMDEMTKLDNLSMKEFEELRKDIEEHPERHSVREARLLRYMTREKFIKDYLDRNTGKAPQDVDITTGGESMNKITVEHIHHLEEGKDKPEYIDGELAEEDELLEEPEE